MNATTRHHTPGIITLATLPWAGLWVLLTGPRVDALVIGVPAIAAATWATLRFRARAPRPPRGLDFWLPWSVRLPRFAAWFLIQSLLGGVDVARRALAPATRLQPGFLDYQQSLSDPSARLFFLNGVSLLPGTLTAQEDGDRLLIHTLDLGADNTAALLDLERAVARLFGEPAPGCSRVVAASASVPQPEDRS
ncbi:MAG: Na+/H+ antiporter subunit E [Gammaproteobacteria bacterium]